MKEIVYSLPDYDYMYLGDNARSPYGTRSFETVYEYTLEGVKYLFAQGCPLVVLACNTASAKALRTIQQKDLNLLAPDRRVLGVIRPTTESIGNFTSNNHVGLFATNGTVLSASYAIEIARYFPGVRLTQVACPMWVPLVENGEIDHEGSRYFIKKYVDELFEKDPEIDCILLACTHYPVLAPIIRDFIPGHVRLISQGGIVAKSLKDYLVRHRELEDRLTKNRIMKFFTTDDPLSFDSKTPLLFGQKIKSEHVTLHV